MLLKDTFACAMSRCVVPGFGNISKNPGNAVVFHFFPKDTKVRRDWERFVGTNFKAVDWNRICSVHFEPAAYNLKSRLLGLRVQANLLKESVPSLFGPNVPLPSSRSIRGDLRRKRALVVDVFKEHDLEVKRLAQVTETGRTKDMETQTM